MFFAAFILVTIDGEHDGLEQRVDFSHGDQAAEVGNMSRLGLEQKEQIAVFLGLFIIREETFLQFCSFLEMARYFILLRVGLANVRETESRGITSSNAIRFWIKSAIRESRYLTSFSRTKFFFD